MASSQSSPLLQTIIEDVDIGVLPTESEIRTMSREEKLLLRAKQDSVIANFRGLACARLQVMLQRVNELQTKMEETESAVNGSRAFSLTKSIHEQLMRAKRVAQQARGINVKRV